MNRILALTLLAVMVLAMVSTVHAEHEAANSAAKKKQHVDLRRPLMNGLPFKVKVGGNGSSDSSSASDEDSDEDSDDDEEGEDDTTITESKD
ncbi:expressed unknown protein [Seminavis robusta]|uniref:Uncharacterized protein n=1 Tax=Seminavis robusta TaxID=568900 RepID=A0A9N8DEU4_9STRA|nr:expressed unknown protein [Seminavis robusta]|eukprot:Sro123_g059560.1 n/a (92) ;mRNA; r:57650-57925